MPTIACVSKNGEQRVVAIPDGLTVYRVPVSTVARSITLRGPSQVETVQERVFAPTNEYLYKITERGVSSFQIWRER